MDAVVFVGAFSVPVCMEDIRMLMLCSPVRTRVGGQTLNNELT